jgi:hypothetical protein
VFVYHEIKSNVLAKTARDNAEEKVADVKHQSEQNSADKAEEQVDVRV